LKDFVGMISKMSDSDFDNEQPNEAESRSRFSSICMNLAFVASKCKNLPQDQRNMQLEWLQELIDDNQGQDALVEVCKFVFATLIKQNN
jgi:hypothetical protein